MCCLPRELAAQTEDFCLVHRSLEFDVRRNFVGSTHRDPFQRLKQTWSSNQLRGDS